MNASIWSDLETAALETLIDRCANIAGRMADSRVAALVALMALSHARLDTDVHANRLEAELRVYPTPPTQGPVAELLDHITCVVSDVARRARDETRLDISARLDDWGYVQGTAYFRLNFNSPLAGWPHAAAITGLDR